MEPERWPEIHFRYAAGESLRELARYDVLLGRIGAELAYLLDIGPTANR